MRETAAALASLPVDDEGAPAGLWGRIADAIGAPGERDRPPTPAATNVVPLRDRSGPFPARIVVPIVAAAALVIAVLAVQVARGRPSRAGDLAAAYNHAVASGAHGRLQRSR